MAQVAYKHAATHNIQFADGNTAQGQSATLVFRTKDKNGTPLNVTVGDGIFCNDLSVTLISVSQLTDHGFSAFFSAKDSYLKTPCRHTIPLDFDKAAGLWFLPTADTPPVSSPANTVTALSTVISQQDRDAALTWHAKHGHPRGRTLMQLYKTDPDAPSPTALLEIARMCHSCNLLRRTKTPDKVLHPRRAPMTEPAGTFWHGDWLGTQHTKWACRDGSCDALILRDAGSRQALSIPVRHKTADAVIRIVKWLQSMLGHATLQRLHFDNEFQTKELTDYCLSCQPPIRLSFSPPYTPQANGQAEALVFQIKALSRTLLYHRRTGEDFRSYAWKYAAHLLNFLPSTILDGCTPADQWPTSPFTHHSLARPPFGCRAIAYTADRPGLDRTTGQRAESGIFLGYADRTSAHTVWIPETDEIITVTDVHFQQDSFPILDLLLSAELLPSDKHVNLDNYRSSGHFTPSHVEPKRLCEYLIKKGIIFTLADEYHLASCGYSFTVLPVRFTTARDKTVTLH